MRKHSKLVAVLLAFSFVVVLSGAAGPQADEKVVCPVMGHEMKKSEAKATYEYNGKTYYFCCEGCKEKFMKDPGKYIQKEGEQKEMYTCPMHSEVKSDKPGKCPKCSMNLEKKMMPMAKMQKHMQMMAEGKPCCSMKGMMDMENIEVNVKNTKQGATLEITSKDKEAVKKIQDMVAKMKFKCSGEEDCCKMEKKEEGKK